MFLDYEQAAEKVKAAEEKAKAAAAAAAAAEKAAIEAATEKVGVHMFVTTARSGL